MANIFQMLQILYQLPVNKYKYYSMNLIYIPHSTNIPVPFCNYLLLPLRLLLFPTFHKSEQLQWAIVSAVFSFILHRIWSWCFVHLMVSAEDRWVGDTENKESEESERRVYRCLVFSLPSFIYLLSESDRKANSVRSAPISHFLYQELPDDDYGYLWIARGSVPSAKYEQLHYTCITLVSYSIHQTLSTQQGRANA